MATSRRRLLASTALAGAGAWLRPWRGWAQAAAPILEIEVQAVAQSTVRLLLRRAVGAEPVDDGAVALAAPGKRIALLHAASGSQTIHAGQLSVTVGWSPLRIRVRDHDGAEVQTITATPDGDGFSFSLGNGPLFGLGEGGPQFSRRGVYDRMVSGSRGYRLATNGSKVPVQWLMGGLGGGQASANAWGMFVHLPLGAFDLRGSEGVLIPEPSAAPSPLAADIFISVGTPVELMGAYAAITGHPQMPPLWSLGYLQSHRTLGTPEEILAEARLFREKRLPCDAMIYLGTGFCPNGWNTANGAFTWNERTFPDPPAALAALHHDHFKAVLHVVLDGKKLTGTVADPCTAPVPPLPQIPEREVACYWPFHRPLFDLGVDGWWPDEGDGYDAPSRLNRNCMYFEGSLQYRPNQRVFALHRNGYAGMQRYASFLWSGDVRSTWITLKTQIATGINAGLSGIPLWGTDIGGFVPTAEYTGELYARWFQFGAFCPLFRSHGRDWRLHLPWGWNTGTLGYPETPSYHPAESELHNPAIEPVCRRYLELRYRLLPYLYAAVREGCDTGVPVIRALWLHYPDDPASAQCDDQFLCSRDLLIAPVTEPGATTRSVVLPPGGWFDFWTNERVAGGRVIVRNVDLATMPLYVRAGAILPLGPVLQHTGETTAEPLRLQVYPGADGAAQIYEDDGATFNFRRGEFMRINLAWHNSSRRLRLQLAPGAKMLMPQGRALIVQAMDGGDMHPLQFHGANTEVKL